MESPKRMPGHLDETAIPGTVHLVDLEGIIRGKHASSSALHDVVLVPAPSSDPDDPLNWSPRRKALSTASLSMYTLMVGIASAAIYSVLEPIADDTGLTLGDLNAGTGYMFLFFVSLRFCFKKCRDGGIEVRKTLILWQIGMGMSLLASCGFAVWKETSVFVFDACYFGTSSILTYSSNF